MKLPLQSQPVQRSTYQPLGMQVVGLQPSACPVPDNVIGQCFDANGPVTGKFNCAACCALRGAISWQGGGIAVAC
jgi:hypothetical protein